MSTSIFKSRNSMYVKYVQICQWSTDNGYKMYVYEAPSDRIAYVPLPESKTMCVQA